MIGEHWDDYQLLCIAAGSGGNRQVYELLKEYELEDKDFKGKYDSKIFKWYRKRHMCRINGIPFDDEPPAKTWKEAAQKKKE